MITHLTQPHTNTNGTDPSTARGILTHGMGLRTFREVASAQAPGAIIRPTPESHLALRRAILPPSRVGLQRANSPLLIFLIHLSMPHLPVVCSRS